MKNAKFWMYLLSLLTLALAWTPDARAATETVDGLTWTYTVSDGKASVGGGNVTSTALSTGTTGDITIPSALGGYPVTSIGNGAFYNCSGLTTVTIPDSVTSIGERAFQHCSGLTSLTIPDGVPSIGLWTFEGCSSLTSLTIPDSVTTIGQEALRDCSSLTSLTIPDRVTSVGFAAFSSCSSLRALYVPDGLRNKLSNASVPSACRVFYRGIAVVNGVEWGYTTDFPGATVTGGPTNGVAQIPSALGGASVVAIGEGAFRDAVGLTGVVIPAGVTTIGASAFSGCSGLTSVTIPDSVTTIGESAFAGCASLVDVEIPASVVNLPLSALDGCAQLWVAMFHSSRAPKPVSLTVTNVVVHFVTQSVPSAAVTPATNATGIVNIIAEVTASNAVAIAQDWAAQYPGFEAAYGSDFTAALTMETGKRDGAGRPLRVWQDYVAGTDPTDPASLFAASIVHDAQTGDMIVSCSPELAPAEAAKRRYSVYGKANLADPGWTLLGTGLPWRASENSVFHFFRVTVEMR